LAVFVRIDHTIVAHEAGFWMPPAVVLIYGNVRGGTPIMLEQPPAAPQVAKRRTAVFGRPSIRSCRGWLARRTRRDGRAPRTGAAFADRGRSGVGLKARCSEALACAVRLIRAVSLTRPLTT